MVPVGATCSGDCVAGETHSIGASALGKKPGDSSCSQRWIRVRGMVDKQFSASLPVGIFPKREVDLRVSPKSDDLLGRRCRYSRLSLLFAVSRRRAAHRAALRAIGSGSTASAANATPSAFSFQHAERHLYTGSQGP